MEEGIAGANHQPPPLGEVAASADGRGPRLPTAHWVPFDRKKMKASTFGGGVGEADGRGPRLPTAHWVPFDRKKMKASTFGGGVGEADGRSPRLPTAHWVPFDRKKMKASTFGACHGVAAVQAGGASHDVGGEADGRGPRYAARGGKGRREKCGRCGDLRQLSACQGKRGPPPPLTRSPPCVGGFPLDDCWRGEDNTEQEGKRRPPSAPAQPKPPPLGEVAASADGRGPRSAARCSSRRRGRCQGMRWSLRHIKSLHARGNEDPLHR